MRILGFIRYFANNFQPYMRSILSERNIVAVLFVMVFVTFSLAHEDTKKYEQIYHGTNTTATLTETQPLQKESKKQADVNEGIYPASYRQ